MTTRLLRPLVLASLVFATGAIGASVAAAAPSGAPVRHVPAAEVVAGTPLELLAEASATTPTLVVHYRPAGQGAYTALELVRKDDAHWVAVLPAAAVNPPGVEYFLVAGGVPVFASAEAPHTLPVVATAADERRVRDDLRVRGRRSQVHTSFEWVDYGSRRVGTTELADRYYRIDADFAYRLWAYPLEELRVGYTRLLGVGSEAIAESDSGFKVAGWFELGLAPVEGLRFDGRVMVMATQSGFQLGGRAEARVGDRDASHIAVGVESLADVGTSGFFRLGWGTVPGLPMAATVEITELPASNRDTGVRLYYDIARAITPGLRVGVRVGYAARTQSVAGFTGGLAAVLDF